MGPFFKRNLEGLKIFFFVLKVLTLACEKKCLNPITKMDTWVC